MSDTIDRCRVFRQLHQSGCFVIPNPWDLGSARLLAQLGFPALATTSSGFAWSLGRPDNHASLEESPLRSNGSGPRGERSMPVERASFSLVDPKGSWSDARISPKPFAG